MADDYGRPIRSDQDFGFNRANRLALQESAGAPAGAKRASVWFNPNTLRIEFLGDAGEVIDPTDRTKHRGAQPVGTITGLLEYIRSQRLDQLAKPTGPVDFNGQVLRGVPDATEDDQPATARQLGQALQQQVSALTEVNTVLAGLTGAALLSIPAIAVATTPIGTYSGTPTIDGVQLTGNVGEIVLLTAEEDPNRNGLYYTNTGEGGGWTRVREGTFDGVNPFPAPTVASGTLVYVALGQQNGRTLWVYDNGRYNDPDVGDDQPGTWTRLLRVSDTFAALAPPTAPINLNGQRLVSAGAPQADNDVVTRAFLYAVRDVLAARTLDQLPPATGPIDANLQRITRVANPVEDTDAATRGYVRSAIAGLDWKDNVKAASTAPVTLNGPQTVGGVQVADGDRVLVEHGDPTKQGIYDVKAGAWERSADADADSLSAGAVVLVTEGDARGVHRLMTPDPIVLGTTPLSWERLPIFDLTATDGVQRVGNEFRADQSVARKFSRVFGDGTATDYQIPIPLPIPLGGSITAAVWDVTQTPHELVDARVLVDPATNTVTVKLAAAAPANGYKLVATG